MELGLPRWEDDSLMHAIVKRRKIDDNGNPIGTESTNPLVNSRACEIKLIDSTTEILTANIIADNLLDHIDEEGHSYLLLDKIIEYRRNNDAFHKSDPFIKTITVNRQRKGYKRLGNMCPFEVWFNQLDRTQGYQTILSHWICWLCSTTRYSRGSGFWMVDTIRKAEEESNNIQIED